MSAILLFGDDGQVGSELRALDWSALGTLVPVPRASADLSRPGAAARTIETHAPALVLNAAAYTAVDKAESEPDLARVLNADAPGEMARACAAVGAPLVHISTDFVFDGRKDGPYREDDPVNPLSVYGETKAAGEEAVRAALPAHVVLRTAWVFSRHGGNFVKTMLRLCRERDRLAVVDDQVGCPTSAAGIAAAIRAIAPALAAREADAFGTYHFAGDDPISWHGFAREIFARATEPRARTLELSAIPSADYPTPARRPANSVLDCGRIAARFGIRPDDWRARLDDVVAALDADRADSQEV